MNIQATWTESRVEVACVLLGQFKNGIWHARLVWKTQGTPVSVAFDGRRVLDREEHRADVVGFYHTHPAGYAEPSDRDHRTMRSWCFCFGKPLLCAIETEGKVRVWEYGDASEKPRLLHRSAIFKNGWLVVAKD